MQCHVCAALTRELGREGETEAAATLKLRARLIAPVADHSQQDVLENVILSSRKRRAHLATELYGHQRDRHGKKSDQLPRFRNAVPA